MDSSVSETLENFLRLALPPPAVRHWTLTSSPEKLIKIGAKVVRHSRKLVFQTGRKRALDP
jgi:hypothetical protein